MNDPNPAGFFYLGILYYSHGITTCDYTEDYVRALHYFNFAIKYGCPRSESFLEGRLPHIKEKIKSRAYKMTHVITDVHERYVDIHDEYKEFGMIFERQDRNTVGTLYGWTTIYRQSGRFILSRYSSAYEEWITPSGRRPSRSDRTPLKSNGLDYKKLIGEYLGTIQNGFQADSRVILHPISQEFIDENHNKYWPTREFRLYLL